MAEVISETMNTPDNKKIVVLREPTSFRFHIPYGVDLEDKSVVKWWDASGGELIIEYTNPDKGKQVIQCFEEHEDDDYTVEIEDAEDYQYDKYDEFVEYDLKGDSDDEKEE